MHEVSKEDAKVLVGDLEDPDDAFTRTVKKLIFEKMGSEYGYAVAMNFLRIYNLIPLPSTSTGDSKEILEAEKAKGIHSQGAMKETKEDALLATAIEMQKEYRAAYMAQGREVRHPTIWDMDTEEPSERLHWAEGTLQTEARPLSAKPAEATPCFTSFTKARICGGSTFMVDFLHPCTADEKIDGCFNQKTSCVLTNKNGGKRGYPHLPKAL